MQKSLARALGALSVILALAGCGARSPHQGQPQPSRALGASPAPVGQAADPLALIGAWQVSGPQVEDGSVLLLGAKTLSLWRRCGYVQGDWNADHDGLFAAATWSGDRPCLNGRGFDVPWLQRSTSFGIGEAGPVLVDAEGTVVARLLPGGSPTPGPNIAPEEAEPPVVDEQARRDFLVADPLPHDLRAPSPAMLVGTWVPLRDTSTTGRAHITFEHDGSWQGSDGCNGSSGRWVLGDDGAVVSTSGGATTLVGCGNVPVVLWLADAARAGLDGDVLVLLDARGQELGRLRRS